MRINVVFDGIAGCKVSAPSTELDQQEGGGKRGQGALPVSLLFEVDLAGVGIGGDLWPAATLFSNMITSEAYREFFRSIFDGKSVLELGAGTGLCGILIDKLFAPSRVTITDQVSHLPLLKTNARLNDCSPRVRVVELDWLKQSPTDECGRFGDDLSSVNGDGNDPPTAETSDACDPSTGTFDVILAMECVYHESLYKSLINTILSCSKRKPGHGFAGRHSTCDINDSSSSSSSSSSSTVTFLGITRQFTHPSFFDLLTASGLRYTLVPHAAIGSLGLQTGGRDCGVLVVRS